MLYRNYESEEENYIEHRYFCHCSEPTHVLCISELNEPNATEIFIGVASNPYWSLWKRIKEAIRLIMGKEVWYADVLIGESDRKKLANVIANKFEE